MAFIRSKSDCIGQIPYGFDLAADGKTLVENPEEQNFIAIMRAWQLDGCYVGLHASSTPAV
jgi:hypothetical protein